ncbi:MAG TPA: DUF4388 domain-containing protein, partial [Kofleriaceae bacterium]|nr:DUF4388 domain-containing protein [Kofleriaceae bacterium]
MASRSGELAMRPLPAVLLDLHEDFATGKLVLKRGRISKTIDLVNGNPVSTASTPRDETLGFFLVNTGVISEEQHRIAVERAAQGGGKLGEALVAMRVLSIEQLIDQLGKQARHKLVQALRWPQGAWRFDDTEPVEGMQLRMVEVVLSGLKETAVEDLDRLARLEGMTFELTQRGTRLRHELRRTYGDRPIAMLGEGAALSELERCFGDRPKARLAIDALLLCDCASTVTAELGLGVEATATLPNDPTAVGGRALTRPAHAGSALFDILFEDLGDAYDGAKPLDFPEAEIHGEDSGVVSTAELSVASENTNDAAEARQAIAAEHQRIQGADYYAVLVVGPRASMDDIDTAFEVRARQLQQQSRSLSDPRDLQRAHELRQAYVAARTTLSDERKRAAYDRELAGGELVSVAPALETELSFRMAEELLAKREWTQAIGLIRNVIARSPHEADYHAALGWAEWMEGDGDLEAADAARTSLDRALEVNP